MTSLALRPHPSTADTVLVDELDAGGLHLVRTRRRDVLLARLRGASLDRRLADGEQAEADRLLAVRAAMLVRPAFRAALADQWVDLAARARRTATLQVPLARGPIQRAADDIIELVDLLRSGQPIAAGGVAAARLLLTTADSPVYALRSGGDLSLAVHAALRRAR